jgi:hypothetical protein
MADEGEAVTVTERIIERFGGIRPMAAKLDTPVTTVQGWKKRGIIPLTRHSDILAAAAREGIALDADELAAADPTPIRPERLAETIILPPPTSALPPSAPPTPAPTVAPVTETVVVRRGSAAAYLALIVALLVLLGVVAAGYGGWQFYLQPLQARVAALEAHGGGSADLDARLAKLEAQVHATSPATASSAQAQPTGAASDGDRLAAIEQQLADLKNGAAQSAQIAKGLSDLQVAAGGRELLAQSIRDIQASTAATQGELERLTAQVTADHTRLDATAAAVAEKRQQGLRAEAALLAVGQLRGALRTSKPYTKDLAAIRGLVGADPEMSAALDQLQPTADGGVATQDDLSKDFGRLAPDIVRSAVVGDGQSWWRQALYHLESVVSIRRVGDSVPGDAVDAIVARAEGKIDDGDLPEAIAGLQALSGLPAQMASPWIAEAQQRVTADQAEADLTRLAIARVSTGAPPPQAASPAPAPTPASQPPASLAPTAQ